MSKLWGLWTGDGWAMTSDGTLIWSDRRRIVQIYLNAALADKCATDEWLVTEIDENGLPKHVLHSKSIKFDEDGFPIPHPPEPVRTITTAPVFQQVKLHTSLIA